VSVTKPFCGFPEEKQKERQELKVFQVAFESLLFDKETILEVGEPEMKNPGRSQTMQSPADKGICGTKLKV